MSQKQAILSYMQKHGSITPLDALYHFGCMRLGARIFELRKDGHNISAVMTYETDKRRTAVKYAKYVLEDEDGRIQETSSPRLDDLP